MLPRAQFRPRPVIPLTDRICAWKPQFYWRFVLCSRTVFGGPLAARLFVPPDHLGDLLGFGRKAEVYRFFCPSFRVPHLVPYPPAALSGLPGCISQVI